MIISSIEPARVETESETKAQCEQTGYGEQEAQSETQQYQEPRNAKRTTLKNRE